MSESWLELAIIAFIILGIGYATFKGGAANPESTGKLGGKINELQNAVTVLGTKVDQIETQVSDLDRSSARAADINRMEADMAQLKREVGTLREAVAAQGADVAHTRHQVDRLYDFIVEKGMSK